ncbi:Hypothetical_protein [Hexamita inflata]|uniref:Hypothetical_protein n=1 Tax=Hexamita inflata TaxID=28002 RepID=A0AA86UDJ8_9EUKA|nr:Hypothetical protein HINF_LOCUS35416 [Hexamita inflata]
MLMVAFRVAIFMIVSTQTLKELIINQNGTSTIDEIYPLFLEYNKLLPESLESIILNTFNYEFIVCISPDELQLEILNCTKVYERANQSIEFIITLDICFPEATNTKVELYTSKSQDVHINAPIFTSKDKVIFSKDSLIV